MIGIYNELYGVELFRWLTSSVRQLSPLLFAYIVLNVFTIHLIAAMYGTFKLSYT